MYSVSLMTKGSCTIRMVQGHYLYLATRDCLSLVTEYCAYHLLKVETRRNTKLITILRIVVNYINNSLPNQQTPDLGLTSRLVVYSDDCSSHCLCYRYCYHFQHLSLLSTVLLLLLLLVCWSCCCDSEVVVVVVLLWSEAFCFRSPRGVETYQINSLDITLVTPRDSQEKRFALRSECLLKLSEAPPKECRLSSFYRTKIVVLPHPVVNPYHPRRPGLSAGGSEGTSRDTCGRSRSFS